MKLILINGPVGVGKSSIALRLHKDIPSSVLIDVDDLRREFSQYRERREESLAFCYEKTEALIEESLREGKDVIVEKTISDERILDMFVSAGERSGADVYELFVSADKETVQDRADTRGYREGGMLTKDKVGMHWDAQDVLRLKRPHAVTIDTTELSLAESYEAVRQAVLSASNARVSTQES